MRFAKYLILFPVIFALSSCGKNGQSRLDRPEDTNLAVWITEPLDRNALTEKGCTSLPGWFGAEEWLDYRYEAKDGKAPEQSVTYLFQGYPDVSDAWVATRIQISDPEITVYGLTMASAQEDIIRRMGALGFARTDDKTNPDYSAFEKNSCHFSFSDTGIYIATDSPTNKNHIVY